MKKPTIKKGMKTFTGCGVGERRQGTLKSLLTPDHPVVKLEKLGYLKGEDEGKYRWFCLTQKGKDHVKPLEAFYAAQF